MKTVQHKYSTSVATLSRRKSKQIIQSLLNFVRGIEDLSEFLAIKTFFLKVNISSLLQ